MTNKKITDFTTGPALTGNEFFPIAIGDKNYKYDLNFISTWFSGKPTAYNFGALADDPAVSPFDGGPIPLGAQYYNTTLNAIRAFGDGGWFTPNLDAAIFALATGAQLVGTPEGTVQDALDGRPTSVALSLPGASSGFGYQQSGTGAVAQTVESNLRKTFRSSDYGAVGSGVETTKLQAAITAAIAAGVKEIRLDDSKEYQTAGLTNYGSVQFVGLDARIISSSGAAALWKVTDVPMVGKLTLPSAFSWFTDEVGLNADGSAYTSFDIDTKKPTVAKSYYVRAAGGSDANTGADIAQGLATLSVAAAKVDVDQIILQPGDYYADAATLNVTQTRDIAITVLGGGRARLFGCKKNSGYTWLPDVTYTSCWTISETSVVANQAVWDETYLDSYGDFMPYLKQASAALCNTTPGSYFYDSGAGKVYVNCIDSRDPNGNDNLKVNRVSYPFKFSGGGKILWMENIDFLGMADCAFESPVTGVQSTVYAKNCTFKYPGVVTSPGAGCFRTAGSHAYLVDCLGARGINDGFNYHSWSLFGGVPINPTRNFELRCVGRHTGLFSGAGNNQASTIHDGCWIIRLNSKGHDTDGQVVADVGGAVSFNINYDGKDSRKATTPRIYEAADAATMYLINCKSNGRRQWDLALGGTSPTIGKCFYYQTGINTISTAANLCKQYNPFVTANPV